LTVFDIAHAGGNFWPSSPFHGGVSVCFILRIALFSIKRITKV